MTILELDLIDQDGAIVSVASADDGVWAQIAAQAQQAASQKGFTIVAGQLFNQPERSITNLGSVQAWLSTQDYQGTLAPPAPSATASPGMSTGAKVAWGVGIFAVVAAAVYAIRSGTR